MKAPELLEIPWQQIRPMHGQPREYFDRGKLRELADSIAALGQITPAQVSPLPAKEKHRYELIDGQRRWHAVQIAGIETLRCEVIDEPNGEERFARSVAANFGREAHTPMEIANALDRMRKTRTWEQCAVAIGRSADYVARYLRLLNLHPDIQGMLSPSLPRSEQLPVTAAMRLAALDKSEQLKAYAKIRASKLSPLKAANLALEDGQMTDRMSRPPRTKEVRGTLLRLRTTLERLDREGLTSSAQVAGADAADAVVKELEAIVTTAQGMLDRIMEPVS